MTQKHIIELLVEANKDISKIINQLEHDDLQNAKIIIDSINGVIRQLDNTVEYLEKNKA